MNGKVWEQYMGANASLVSKDNTYGIALYQSYRNRNPYDADGDGFSELGKLNLIWSLLKRISQNRPSM